MADRNGKLDRSNPFASVSLQDLMDNVVPVTPPSEVVQAPNAYWHGGFGITTIGLYIENVDEQEWLDFIPAFEQLKSVSDWAKADWCAYGADVLKHPYEFIASVAGMQSGKSAEVYASISRNTTQLIRINSPSFSHVRKVLSMDEDLQLLWLQKAVANGWSSKQLGVEIKGHRLASGKHIGRDERRVLEHKKTVRSIVSKTAKLPEQARHEFAEYLRQLAAQLDSRHE